MEEELANLNIVDDDEELVQAFDDEDYAEEDFNICLLGRVLMDSIVHFPSMRNLLANLWHPIEGIFITEIEDKRILFKFYNKVGLYSVWDVHNISLGLKSEGLARQFGNSIGLGHGKSFCPSRLTLESQEVAFGWDISLRSPPRRATTTTSKWLQEEPVEAGNSRIDWEENKRVRLHENPYVQGHNRGKSNSDSEERSFGLVDGTKRQRVNARSMERIRKSCEFGNRIDVGANGSRGGLSLGWKKGISITLRSFFHSHIDVEVKKEYGKIL
ncbi:hypothetical protein Gotur_018575, partial [Gossypium turneri]